MVGFKGTRLYVALPGGFGQQVITCKDRETQEFWRGIFPEGAPVYAVWQSEMVILLGECKHMLIFQSPIERDQWRHTFYPGRSFFARWSNEATLVLGCEMAALTAGSPTSPAASPFESEDDDIDALSDKQLRTRLTEMSVEYALEEPRDILIEKLKTAVAMAEADPAGEVVE